MATTANAVEAEEITERLFRTPEGRMDPYPLYHRLRDLAPVHYSEAARAWMLTRYDDGYSALRDPRLGKDFVERMDATRPWWRERPSLARGEKSMLNVDGPEHTRLRRAVSKVFTFRSVEKLRPAIEGMVDRLLDPLAEAGGGDLVTELAFPLPVKVIGELLGVPEDDREQFRDLVRDITAVFEPQVHREQFDVADEATRTIDAYFYDLIAAKRKEPTDDLLGRLVTIDDEDRLDDEELVTLATLLFAAGFETTTNLIGNAMVGFLRHPEQMDILRNRPELCSGLAPEILRYDGTVQMVLRQVKDDYPIDGQVLPRGDSVVIVVAAGNHDPARYRDPDALDVTRTDVKPLSFGGGIHFCLGAALAAVEVEIVFRKIFERFDDVGCDGEIPSHKDRLTLRGMDRLPLVLETTGRSRATVEAAVAQPPPVAPPPPARTVIGNGAGLPPRPEGDDSAWRAAFRRRVEEGVDSGAELEARVRLLNSIPLFAACTPAELAELAGTAYPLAFDPGDVLIVEGTDPGECYVVAEGEAAVTIAGRTVATVGPDDVVGEKGPIEGRPRAATVTALTHMITYAISRTHLQRLLDSSPAAAAAMRELVASRYGNS